MKTKQLLQNLFNKMSYFPQLLPGTLNWNISSNLKLVKTAYDSDTLNAAVLQGGRIGPTEIKAVKHTFEPNKPFGFWLPDNDHNETILQQEGFQEDETHLTMRCDLTTLDPQLNDIDHFTVSQANDYEQIIQFGETLASIADPVDNELRRFYKDVADHGYTSEQGLIKLYNGYYQDQPVSAGAVYIEGDYCGIYDMATRPQHRRQGFASHLLHTMLLDMQQQAIPQAYLLADTQAYQIYKRLGFESFDYNKTYVKFD